MDTKIRNWVDVMDFIELSLKVSIKKVLYCNYDGKFVIAHCSALNIIMLNEDRPHLYQDYFDNSITLTRVNDNPRDKMKIF